MIGDFSVFIIGYSALLHAPRVSRGMRGLKSSTSPLVLILVMSVERRELI